MSDHTGEDDQGRYEYYCRSCSYEWSFTTKAEGDKFWADHISDGHEK